MKKSRLWCFTNFRLDFDYEKLIKACKVKYIMVGLEKCPTTGKEHHQGYLWMKNPTGSKKNVAAMLGKCHVEMCRGNWEQNCNYCAKDDNIQEYGQAPAQGKRGDILANVQDIAAGIRTAEEFCIEDPVHYHMYGRTLHKAEDIAMRKRYRTEMTTCEWIHGPTGTGKSHTAFSNFSPETHYVWKKDTQWQDGYMQQDTVIINEFRGELKMGALLELVDKWPYHVERRGREAMPFISKHIIITSSMPPEELYCNLAENDKLEQLIRRIIVTKMEQKYSEG